MDESWRRTRTGFTLLELLVSVAIIALLAAITMIGIGEINAKKRDANRIARLKEINNALNLYINTAIQYPVYEGVITGSDPVSTALENSDSISKTPLDPLNSDQHVFTYSSDGTTFRIGFCLETNSIKGYSKGCGNKISP